MTSDLRCDAVSSSAEHADLARRRLDEAVHRLGRAVLRAHTLAAAVQWQTDTARRFREHASDLPSALAGASAEGRGIADEVRWLSVRIAVRRAGACG